MDESETDPDVKHVVEHHVHHAHHAHYDQTNPIIKEAKMDNIYSSGNALGGGLGAGLLGGVLGGVLLNRGGLLGNANDNGGGIVTPTMLSTSLNAVTEASNNTTVMQTLGDIKAAIPYNEAQMQLALAGATADINNHSATNAAANAAGFASTQRYIGDSLATAIAGQGEIKTAIATQAASILAANNILSSQLANSTFQLATTVVNDGDKTRTLLIAQNDAMLNRQLAVAESALLDQRAASRSRDVEVNVSQTVNQNQMQMQAQNQQQQQLILLSQIANGLNNVTQMQHTAQTSIIAGNQGRTSNSQVATPTNVNA